GFGWIILNSFIPNEASDKNTLAVQTCPLVEDAADSRLDTPQQSLSSLLTTTQFEDADAAKSAVDNGEYAVAVIIPANFSAALEPQIPERTDGISALVEVYGDSNRTLDASIVNSVVQSFVNQFLTGTITIESAINTLIDYNPLAAGLSANRDDVQAVLGCAFTGDFNPISIIVPESDDDTDSDDTSNLSSFSWLMVVTGSAQAVFFALFSGQFGIISIVEERRAGTLQRMLASPTSRTTILAGKLLGTLITVIFQVSLILIALMLIASIMEGQLQFIWGTNLPLIAVTVIAVGLAVCGLGVLVSGLARTPEQVNTIGTVTNMILGLAGGAFGFSVGAPISFISLIYWGTDAFQKLAAGQGDIVLNLIVLLLQALVFFIIGSWLFERRVEV
ncbi:MAG: ABC transporter permease, partial [Aggregatilineales bacterium]